MKKPYVPIYKGDWKQDQALQCCELAAQAVWLLILFSLDDSPSPGFLLKPSGETPTPDELARMLGRSPEEVLPHVAELERNRVFSRVTSADVARGGLLVRLPKGRRDHVIPVSPAMLGAIYSRRMIRDLALALSKTRDSSRGAQPAPQSDPQSDPQSLDPPDPDPIPFPDLPPPTRAREEAISDSTPIVQDLAVEEGDAVFAAIKQRWNESPKLLPIALWDDAERTAFHANIWRPLRARGMSEEEIRADCELLIERAEESDQVTAARSFLRLATRPQHLRQVLGGAWENRRERAPPEPPKTAAGARIQHLASLAREMELEEVKQHDEGRDLQACGDRRRSIPASTAR